MKKITLLLTILAFVLAFGTAYAMDITGERDNGITVFAIGPVTYDSVPSAAVEAELYAEGSAAGGVTEAESKLEPNNGITIFAVGPADFDSGLTWGRAAELSEGSAAGGMAVEGSHMKLYNGITVF